MSEETQGCDYTEDYCRKGYGCVLLIAALVSLVASITALALCGTQDRHCDAGISWAIGILGTLLTFAVTWNIWQVIDTKNTVKKAGEASEKLKELERSLEEQSNLFNQHNLEIQHLIDAHAKISEAEKIVDLPNKYNTYIEALDLLLQSNVSLSYEQFDKIILKLEDLTSKFPNVDNADDAWNIIVSEQEFEWGYKHLIAKLEQRSDEIEALRRKLTAIKEFREESINQLKSTDIGKRALQINAEIEEQRKRLEAEYTARKAAEAKGATPPNPTEQ